MSFFDLQGLLQAQEHRHTPRHTDKIKHVFFFLQELTNQQFQMYGVAKWCLPKSTQVLT